MPAPAPRDSLAEVVDGAFARSPSTFLSALGSPAFPVERGRYVLYVSLACPWACRVLAVLALRGLGGLVRVVVCCPTWARTAPGADEHRGWVFRARAAEGSVDAALAGVPLVDPVFGCETVRGIYELLCAEAGAPPPAKFTVPLLVDARARRVVCNESAVLLRDLGGPAVAEFAARAGPELRPAALAAAVDAENDAMYDALNNGVYKCGFATTQAAYDAAAAALAAWLDAAEARLADGRAFLLGAALTEADVRAYVTLVRYDPVYVVHFKCAFRSVRAMPALAAYVRRVHAALRAGAPAGAPHPVTDLAHIKQHYFGSHPTLNPHGIVPRAAPGEGEELEEA